MQYPDKTTGLPSSAEQEVLAYNALGQRTLRLDRNGSIHEYEFDVLGRPTADKVTLLGSGVDTTVQRLETAYDEAGRPFQWTSYNEPVVDGDTLTRNQVRRVYNGLDQVLTEYQAVGGAVDTDVTPKVQYAYSFVPSGTNNHSRVVSLTYPNGRVVESAYTGLDDRISRLSALAEGSTTLEQYAYLGLGTVVQRTHPKPAMATVQVGLTYLKQGAEADGPAGDQYTGLDRFGRVVDQRWLRSDDVNNPMDRFQYGYDRAGNRQYRANLVRADHSELYHESGVVDTFDIGTGLLISGAYDRLGQLTSFARGTLNGAKDAIPTPTGPGAQSQSWTLDAQGNWTILTTTTALGTSTQNRTHNQQNQASITGLANQLTYVCRTELWSQLLPN